MDLQDYSVDRGGDARQVGGDESSDHGATGPRARPSDGERARPIQTRTTPARTQIRLRTFAPCAEIKAGGHGRMQKGLFGEARSSNATSTAAVLRWHGTFAHGTVGGCGVYMPRFGADACRLQQHGASRVRLARQLSDDCRFVFGAQAGRHTRHLGHPRRPQFAQQ